jgi:hypothetical protein
VLVRARYVTLTLAAARNRRRVNLATIVKLYTDRGLGSFGFPEAIT